MLTEANEDMFGFVQCYFIEVGSNKNFNWFRIPIVRHRFCFVVRLQHVQQHLETVKRTTQQTNSTRETTSIPVFIRLPLTTAEQMTASAPAPRVLPYQIWSL